MTSQILKVGASGETGNNEDEEAKAAEAKTASPSCMITMSFQSSKAGALMGPASAAHGSGLTESLKSIAPAVVNTSAMMPYKRALTLG